MKRVTIAARTIPRRFIFLAALLSAVSALFCSHPSGPALAAAKPAVIVMYHHVTPDILPGPFAKALTVTPAEFEAQLSWLSKHGCKAVTVERIVADAGARSAAGCEAALTFDDGYDDVVRYGLPLLQKYRAAATFYITSGYVGQPGHVSRASLRKLTQNGMEIAAHTVHHYDLTTLSATLAGAEIENSRSSLQTWTGTAISSFAYPAGRLNAAVVNAVRAAGFANAVTTAPGDVDARADRFMLPRYRILRGQGLQLFALRLGLRRDPSARVQAAYDEALHHIARARIAGNEPQIAESVAVALLARRFPEPIMKVHVLAIPHTAVAGILLSGLKFHGTVSRRQFSADVHAMANTAFDAAPSLREVDIWATVPITVPVGKPVSGDYAVPTVKTVYSSVVTRQGKGLPTTFTWGTTFWDPHWLQL